MKKKNTIKFLNQEENQDLFEKISCDTTRHACRNKAIFQIAEYCALRASEIGLLRLDNYNANTHSIYCQRLKNGSNNTLLICDANLIVTMDEYIKHRNEMHITSEFLFPSAKGSPISRQRLDELIKEYGTKAGIPPEKQHFHVLRHTRAIELGETGFDLKEIQYWLGHKRIENTMIYLQFTTRQHQIMYQKLKSKGDYEHESIY
ncbi:MAG: tyrosine-type recombinase/integrase [Lachnospiraceae bacterium]